MLKVDEKQAAKLGALYGTYQDVAIERVILSAVWQCGADALTAIAQFVDESCFTLQSNREVWSVLCEIHERDLVCDLPTFYSVAKEMGFDKEYARKDSQDFIRALSQTAFVEANIEKHAQRLQALKLRGEYRAAVIQALVDDDLASIESAPPTVGKQLKPILVSAKPVPKPAPPKTTISGDVCFP